jgi:hypothetical protein
MKANRITAKTSSTEKNDTINQIHFTHKLENVCIMTKMSHPFIADVSFQIFSVHSSTEVLYSRNIVNARRGEATIRPKSQL